MAIPTDSEWRTSTDPAALIERLDEDMVHSAFTMFHTGNFDAIGQLGESLEVRGCADTDILLHCMQERHVRGCWLVDEITGMRHRLRC